MRAAVEPLLCATIDLEPEYCESRLLNPAGTIQAQAIELSAVRFENGSIPTISDHAQFQTTFDWVFEDAAAIYDRQERTDRMDWALRFGFCSEDGGEWDAAGDHTGMDSEMICR
jgi:hypothetical protein